MAPLIIATINLKGGVGKTTTTLALAEFASAELGRKVLVIDLDPQTNLTTALIGEKRWAMLNTEGRTLATLFHDSLRPHGQSAQFDVRQSVQRNVSPVDAAATVDLLPCSPDIIDVQDRLAAVEPGRFYANRPIDLLRRAVGPVLDDYDLVLVDCPPNLGIVTLNGLRICHGYIIPTIPDVLSTYGIPQITRHVSDFAHDLGEGPITPYGVVVNKYQANSPVHRDVVEQLRANGAAGKVPALFDTFLPERSKTAAAGERTYYSTLRQKYGYQSGEYKSFRALTVEVIFRAHTDLQNRTPKAP